MEYNGDTVRLKIDTGAGFVEWAYGISHDMSLSADSINVDNKSTKNPRRIGGKLSGAISASLYIDGSGDAVVEYLYTQYVAGNYVDFQELDSTLGKTMTGQGIITSFNPQAPDNAGRQLDITIDQHDGIARADA
jgi:hypothetical protein